MISFELSAVNSFWKQLQTFGNKLQSWNHRAEIRIGVVIEVPELVAIVSIGLPAYKYPSGMNIEITIKDPQSPVQNEDLCDCLVAFTAALSLCTNGITDRIAQPQQASSLALLGEGIPSRIDW